MKKKTNKVVILGIDPGLADTGYGIITKEGNKLSCICFGAIKTNAKTDFCDRLAIISEELKKIILKYKPEIVGIEEIYFCKNVKTALLVGQAKGAIILTCKNSGLKIREFTPLQIKSAVTGYGKADKNQVQQMVKLILAMKKTPAPDHAADALAAAICCTNNTNI